MYKKAESWFRNIAGIDTNLKPRQLGFIARHLGKRSAGRSTREDVLKQVTEDRRRRGSRGCRSAEDKGKHKL